MKQCDHCGDEIIGTAYQHKEKEFCCNGCKSVFILLSENDLGKFYDLETKSGNKPSSNDPHKYAFLDIPEIRSKYIFFEENTTTHIRLFLPSIHCSSCIYLLENIKKINPSIQTCEVNFTQRIASISYNSSQLRLSELAQLLDAIGYPPNFGERKKNNHNTTKKYLYKLGIAGFAFGSIMLWSFPEYLGIENDHSEFRSFTSILSFLVSIPVLLYSANEYLISAYKAIKYKALNLDVPIAIGIIALYFQSTYSIFMNDGPGYMDSFAAFIFFLLIGKWFQSKTYQSLSFDRDYTSYFPVAVSKLVDQVEVITEIEHLNVGDYFFARNEEIIPCDSLLISEIVTIDYSFVTGESRLITKQKGDFVFAGGRVIGGKSKFQVQKETNRSHLTQLWNNDAMNENESKKSDRFSVNFLLILFAVVAFASIYWLFRDASRVLEIAVAVLIVACPCALALSKPFTYGNIMRLLGRKGLYLKNAEVIAKFGKITDIVFDKTGTLTSNESTVSMSNTALTLDELNLIFSAASSSNHPYSKQIAAFLYKIFSPQLLEITSFKELKGKGTETIIDGHVIKLGSKKLVNSPVEAKDGIGVSIDEKFVTLFCIESTIRPNIEIALNQLSLNYDLHLLSGDDVRDEEKFTSIFPKNSKIYFNQTPLSKMEYVEQLKQEGKSVLMIGDGLNDVGAIKKSDLGISVSENIFQFTPSSDAIIASDSLAKISNLLKIALFSKTILRICLLFSILYNFIGLSFAISGQLSPIVAAILMPVSSITIVFIATFGTLFFSPKN